ncbi:MAG: AAA family ATPase [Nannocystis sp.]|nr:ATP-binding protein [Nannocystis sp.]MBA3547755.1 AAA family ATPase [Nannocystis sp.]
MITRLEVDGFKSLRDFAVDLEPFTVFIGPNSAGKSNVLEALALLSRLASQPIPEAFKKGRGRPSDQFTRAGSETARTMRFAVEFLIHGEYRTGQPPSPGAQSRYRYELTIERRALPSGTERLLAREERLRAMRSEEDSWIQSRPGFAKYATYAGGGANIFGSLLNDLAPQMNRVVGLPPEPDEHQIPPSQTALPPIRYFRVEDLRANLVACRTLQMGTARLGEPSDRIDSGDLAPDASNLPTVLAGLPPSLLGEIRADLVALVPGIASFDVVPDGDEMRIDFELSGGDRMPARLVSDGTLRILVLLTALRLEPRPYLACIEEPENGIYPGRLRALLDLFREEAMRQYDDPEALARLDARFPNLGAMRVITNLLPTQLILTTHSPVILAALRKHPEHLRFVDAVRRDGHRLTRVRTVGPTSTADHGRFTVTPREIDLILDATQSEDPA